MAKATTRIASIDIFRGMAVVFMIIVNYPGSRDHVYGFLKFSAWNGASPADTIFPAFLFIMGVSMWYSLKKYGHELNSLSVFRIIRRVVALFALGLFLNIFPYFSRDYSTLRIMGILQHIALVYLIGAVLCLSLRKNYLWIAVAIILIFIWILLALFRGPDPYGLESNVVRRIDMFILGKAHLYQGFSSPFEPHGLVGALPAACSLVIGFYIGGITGGGNETGKNALKILLIGIATTGLGLFWNIFLPVNKYLWTGSYILLSTGIVCVIYGLVYFITDVIKFEKWGIFFNVFGSNALFSFTLAEIFVKMLQIAIIDMNDQKISLYQWIYGRVFMPVAGERGGSLIFAIVILIMIWLASLILYRKKVYIRF
jgi:predicted acyltransferase